MSDKHIQISYSLANILFYHKITCIFIICVYLSCKFVVAIYALFPPIFLAWKVDSANFSTFRMYETVYLYICISVWDCILNIWKSITHSLTYSLTLNLKARDASASKNGGKFCFQKIYFGPSILTWVSYEPYVNASELQLVILHF